MRIAEGDEMAFKTLYTFYAPRLRAYVWKFTRSADYTEEIIQESFIQVWLSRDKLAEVRYLKAWIYRLTIHNCMKFLRKIHNDEKKIEQLALRPAVENINESPFEQLQVREIKKAAQQAISGLNDTRRTIYRMNREQGLSPGEIAIELNIPVGTVKNNLTAANRQIREHLAKIGYQLPLFLLALIKLF